MPLYPCEAGMLTILILPLRRLPGPDPLTPSQL